jgi:hypothetical protein
MQNITLYSLESDRYAYALFDFCIEFLTFGL